MDGFRRIKYRGENLADKDIYRMIATTTILYLIFNYKNFCTIFFPPRIFCLPARLCDEVAGLGEAGIGGDFGQKKIASNPTRIERNRDWKLKNWSSGTIRAYLPYSLGLRIEIKNRNRIGC
jgi:hypothetical protein